MEKNTAVVSNFDFYSIRMSQEVALITFQENMLFPLVDLEARDSLLNDIDRLSGIQSIKVILMLHNPYMTGCNEYYGFYENLKAQETERMALHRLGNIVNQLVLKIIGSEKFFIHAGGGEAISLIFNIGLACDYRIVEESTVFHNPYMELGLLPKGGGPFFLLHRLGRNMAYEMLLSRSKITASEALKLGLLDKVVPVSRLEDAALSVAHRFGQIPSRTLSGIKRLVNFSFKDLKDYLETENQEIIKAGENYFRTHLEKVF